MSKFQRGWHVPERSEGRGSGRLATPFVPQGVPPYPTWLFYNPHPEAKTFHTDVGPAPADLYDTLQHDFVERAVRGRCQLTLPSDAAAVIVAAPAGGKLTRDGKRTLIETVVVDFGDQTD